MPADLYGSLHQARIVITNFHAFQLRETKEGRGIASLTKQLLAGAIDAPSPFQETPDQMVARVCREFGTGKREIVVLKHAEFDDQSIPADQEKPASCLLNVGCQASGLSGQEWTEWHCLDASRKTSAQNKPGILPGRLWARTTRTPEGCCWHPLAMADPDMQA